MERFRLAIGAKRQITLPVRLIQLLALEEGSQIQIDIEGDHAVLIPLVAVPRHLVTDSLRQEMESRRGFKSSDQTLEQLLEEMKDVPKEKMKKKPIQTSDSSKRKQLAKIEACDDALEVRG